MTKRKKHRQLRHRIYRSPTGQLPKLHAGELLLEHFSDQELFSWRAKSKDFQSYHYLWYFELEAQRADQQSHLLNALRRVPSIEVPLDGWGRAIAYKYSNAPLSCIGSLKWVGGRFNYGVDIDATRFAPFPALYLAEDFETGLREMHGLTRENSRAGLTAGELALSARGGVTWAPVSGSVGNIFDLTTASHLGDISKIISSFKLSKRVRDRERQMSIFPLRLIASAQELFITFMAENWREYPSVWSTPANPQLFGHLLAQAGFEGVLFCSTRTRKRNLALFPRQFKESSSIVQVMSPPSTAVCTELSAGTYAELEVPQISVRCAWWRQHSTSTRMSAVQRVGGTTTFVRFSSRRTKPQSADSEAQYGAILAEKGQSGCA